MGARNRCRQVAGRLRWRSDTELSSDADERALMARTFAYLFGFGGLLVLGTIPLLGARGSSVAGVVVPAVLALAVAALMVVRFDRLPLWLFRWLPDGGAILASVVVYFGGAPTAAAYAMFYFWVILSAFYFFGRARAAATLAFVAVSYAVVLTARQVDNGLLVWIMTMGALLVVGVLIGALTERMRGLVARLADAARTDPLTGLANRRAFEEHFDVELGRALRSDRQVSVLLADLDFFKVLNDREGHEAGDLALQRAGAVLAANARLIDTVARIGGEEFAIVAPECDQHEALLLAERLRHQLRSAFLRDGRRLTVSIGVASCPRHGADRELLLRCADEALYAAKEMGRDRAVIYSPEVAAGLRAARARAAQDGSALATVVSLSEALDFRHQGSADHSRTVGYYAELMARALELPEADVQRIHVAGVLHDIGKLGIADAVLEKPGPLDRDDWVEMRKHPENGARILQNASLHDISDWVVAHHERPDGRGYPHGLDGEQIPLPARILAVADAYEAMTGDRVYRLALPVAEARAELLRNAGTQFDSGVVEALLRALEREESPGLPTTTSAAKR
jgi:diguanylate cyclase (GGDEF)-like protein/putative nucleotidyltransferase with HDIG domain